MNMRRYELPHGTLIGLFKRRLQLERELTHARLRTHPAVIRCAETKIRLLGPVPSC